jgi:hypothetical protein
MPEAQPSPDAEPEIVDALPVDGAGPVPALAPRGAAPAPVVRQAAAVAATSFVAGAATIAAVRVVRRGGLRRRNRRSRRALGQVVATRSFLVDVHLLAPRD